MGKLLMSALLAFTLVGDIHANDPDNFLRAAKPVKTSERVFFISMRNAVFFTADNSKSILQGIRLKSATVIQNNLVQLRKNRAFSLFCSRERQFAPTDCSLV